MAAAAQCMQLRGLHTVLVCIGESVALTLFCYGVLLLLWVLVTSVVAPA